MSNWLCIGNYENWDYIKIHNVWGVAKKHSRLIKMVKPNDVLIIYLRTKKRALTSNYPSSIAGIFKAISSEYIDNSPIFPTSFETREVFPFRVNLEPILIPEKPVLFKPLVESLRFIRNKEKWGGHLQGVAMLMLSDNDYQIIMDAVKKN